MFKAKHLSSLPPAAGREPPRTPAHAIFSLNPHAPLIGHALDALPYLHFIAAHGSSIHSGIIFKIPPTLVGCVSLESQDLLSFPVILLYQAITEEKQSVHPERPCAAFTKAVHDLCFQPPGEAINVCVLS
jgi:hypothetical protein